MQQTMRLSFLASVLFSITACDLTDRNLPKVDSDLPVLSLDDTRTALAIVADKNLLMSEFGESGPKSIFFPEDIFDSAIRKDFGETVDYFCNEGGKVTISNFTEDYTGYISAKFKKCHANTRLLHGTQEIYIEEGNSWEADSYTTVWHNYSITQNGYKSVINGSVTVNENERDIEIFDSETEVTLNANMAFQFTGLSDPIQSEVSISCKGEYNYTQTCNIESGSVTIGTDNVYHVTSISHFEKSIWDDGAVTHFESQTADTSDVRLYSVEDALHASTFDENQFEIQYQINPLTWNATAVQPNNGDKIVPGIDTVFEQHGSARISVLSDAEKLAAIDPQDPKTLHVVDTNDFSSTTLKFDSPILSMQANGEHDGVYTGHDGFIVHSYLMDRDFFPQDHIPVGIGKITKIISEQAFQAVNSQNRVYENFYTWGSDGIITSGDIYSASSTDTFSSYRYASPHASFVSADATSVAHHHYNIVSNNIIEKDTGYSLQNTWRFVEALDDDTLVVGDGTLLSLTLAASSNGYDLNYLGKLAVPAELGTFEHRIAAAAQHINTDELLYATAPAPWSSSYDEDFPLHDDPHFHDGATSLWLSSADAPWSARQIPLPMSTNSSPSMPFEVVDITSGIEPHQFFITGRWQTHSLAYTTVVLELDISALDD